jgi:TPR repeat protein
MRKMQCGHNTYGIRPIHKELQSIRQFYDRGIDIAKIRNAVTHFTKVVGMGRVPYITRLGHISDHVPQDYPDAVKWYRKAAKQGYAP